MNFNHDIAFSRNLGWLTEQEFKDIRKFKIAIAGMGGVGGGHLISLIRMGFCHFVIADFDHFELHNFNRQYGADMTSINQKKAEVMKEIALRINPEAQIQVLGEGVQDHNLDEFLKDVDVFVDGLDLFALTMRQKIFAEAKRKNITSVTAGPLGFGASCLVFSPDAMSFDQYFNFKTGEEYNNLLKFVLGIGPSLMHIRYLLDRNYSNLKLKKTSSTSAGCFAATAMICTEVVKICFNRGIRYKTPTVVHCDFYLNRFKVHHVIWGMKNPWMRIKLFVLKKMISEIN